MLLLPSRGWWDELDGAYRCLDDMFVTSMTWKTLMGAPRLLLQRLRKTHFIVNLVMSNFAHARLVYLGHEVGRGRQSNNSQHLPVVKMLTTMFLGIAGYYQRFYPICSKVSSLLTDLMSPKKEFVWTSECQNAFEKIRSILVTNSVKIVQLRQTARDTCRC